MGGTKGGLSVNLDDVCDGEVTPWSGAQGRHAASMLSEGQLSDHRGARVLLTRLPRARELIAGPATIATGFGPRSSSAASRH